MVIHDANHITDQTISTDICIIGAGPAGLTLAKKLSDCNVDIVIADSGGRGFEKKSEELNVLNIESNFRYRNSESKRARQIGGTASLWAGRIVPFSFDPKFDKEWGNLPKSVTPYYDDAFRQLNSDPAIQYEHGRSDRELYGYWAPKTQRFNASSLKSNIHRGRIYMNLTFTGDSEFKDDRILKLLFINRKRQVISIDASRFVFAMGGIENSRMLLIMDDQLEKRMKQNFKNVGKYIMDHPRISHGLLDPQSVTKGLSRYQMKVTSHGIYKTGIRNDAKKTRVYCNIIGAPGKFTRKVLRFPWRLFQNSSKRLLVKETGLLRTLATQCKTLPLLSRSEQISTHISRFVNNKEHRNYRVMTYCEQRPRIHNQIELDPATDKNNLNIPRLINHIHTDELNEVLSFYMELDILARKFGCNFKYNEDYISNPANFTDASHIMGGTRYSDDKSRAVVDDNLRVIGIPNLHITGSSVFPTSGVENPTHLISSLSLYLASLLK